MNSPRADDLDPRFTWGAMGQKDDLTFAFLVRSRRENRQRIVIVRRDSDGKAAIVELGRWSLERPRLPHGFKAIWAPPPRVMAAERLRIYGADGTGSGA